jgi:glycosyltransferase involved in cell wall biosynthesis
LVLKYTSPAVCVAEVSAIVPTLDRAEAFRRTLFSLAEQSVLPAELIVIDASRDDSTRQMLDEWKSVTGNRCSVVWERATKRGAAAQRNQGIDLAKYPYLWFFDDDIIFEANCVENLWAGIVNDDSIGGVNALIVNQLYVTPGRVSRTLFRLLNGRSRESYAGMCIGPALNLLPEDNPKLPDVVPVEWLNTTCTIYRREALPNPTFDTVFSGYSMLEDLTLSLRVGKSWKLANVRTARIFHDSQPGEFKSKPAVISRMELINRHYVMTSILNRRGISDYARLALLELFGIVTPIVSPSYWSQLPAVLSGKLRALRFILFGRAAQNSKQQS